MPQILNNELQSITDVEGTAMGDSIVELKRRIRKYSVLNLIREKGPISRAQISQLTSINIPTVTSIVNDLRREGLVCEDGYGESSGGRRAAWLRIDPSAAVVLGLDVQPEEIRGLACDLNGAVLGRSSLLTEATDGTGLIACIRQVLSDTMASSKIPRKDVGGIGLGIAGIVDRERGVLRSSPFVESWKDVPVRYILQEEFRVPVCVEEDLKAAAIGEHWFAQDKRSGNIIYIQVGDYIGSAVVIHGEVYEVAPQGAGGIGHIVVQDDGPPCYCGSSGCLETLASESPIISMVVEGINRGIRSKVRELAKDISKIDIQTIIKAAEMGDTLAFNALDRAGRYVGVVLAGVINILNPDRVVVGGSLARAGENFLGSMRREIKSRVAFGWNTDQRLVPPRSGDDVVALGAAALVIEEIFHANEIKSAVCV